jgi:peptidoglycan/LPS O-acetylase OafA/YrhL
MAIGGIGAYLVAYEKKVLSFIFRKDIQWVIYIVTIGLLIARAGLKYIEFEKFPSFNYEWYSILFCCIIINLAANPKSIIRLDYTWMNYLGKVSYGLYMYSPIMRILALESVEKVFGKEISGWEMNIVCYLLTIGSTIIVAILSYEFFEKKIMRMGKRPGSARVA